MSTTSNVRSTTPDTKPRPEILTDEVSVPKPPRDNRQNRRPEKEVKAFHVFRTFERNFGDIIAKAVSKGGLNALTEDAVVEAIKAGQDEARKIAYDLIHQQKQGGNRFTTSSRFLAKWGEVLGTYPQDVLPPEADKGAVLEPFPKGVERLLADCLASEEHCGKARQLLDEATRTGLLNAFAIAALVAVLESAE